MSEIDVLLIELEHLLTELKDSRGNEELKERIRRLFARANPLIRDTDDWDEMERVYKSAAKVAGMASYLLNEKDSEIREFFQLLGIEGNRQVD